MGADHARILSRDIAGVELAAVYDADGARARAVAEETGAKEVAASPEALIRSSGVDAVLIASPDATHAPLSRLCLEAGKPALCEKPLAILGRLPRLIAEEARLGKRLIQLGFMRRYDPSYVDDARRTASGELGRALMMHFAHRNVSTPAWFTSDMAITNSAPHEFDVAACARR